VKSAKECKRARKSAKEPKERKEPKRAQKSAKELERAQKSAKERERAQRAQKSTKEPKRTPKILKCLPLDFNGISGSKERSGGICVYWSSLWPCVAHLMWDSARDNWSSQLPNLVHQLNSSWWSFSQLKSDTTIKFVLSIASDKGNQAERRAQKRVKRKQKRKEGFLLCVRCIYWIKSPKLCEDFSPCLRYTYSHTLILLSWHSSMPDMLESMHDWI
jgi:hypothetical protein